MLKTLSVRDILNYFTKMANNMKSTLITTWKVTNKQNRGIFVRNKYVNKVV